MSLRRSFPTGSFAFLSTAPGPPEPSAPSTRAVMLPSNAPGVPLEPCGGCRQHSSSRRALPLQSPLTPQSRAGAPSTAPRQVFPREERRKSPFSG